MAKHTCKHCGTPRAGHKCPVAKRFIAKHDDADFVIIAAAVALTTPQAEVERLLPADPAPSFALPDFGSSDGDPYGE